MNGRYTHLEPELKAFLTPRKIERQAPPGVRARALARARAVVAAGGWMAPVRSAEQIAAPVARAWAPMHLALFASVAVAAGAIGTGVALRDRPAEPAPKASPARPPQSKAIAAPAPPPAVNAPLPSALLPVAPPPAASPEPRRVAPPAAESDPFAAELEVLARAQTAFTRRDFARALTVLGEHARRFPNGHLAEEREALRVRSLLGSGRSDDGQRAAAAFARRFPRSVLLPRVAESQSAK